METYLSLLFVDDFTRNPIPLLIIGNLGKSDTSLYNELICQEERNFRYTGTPWVFQSLPVVVSDLMGNLRLGITHPLTNYIHKLSTNICYNHNRLVTHICLFHSVNFQIRNYQRNTKAGCVCQAAKIKNIILRIVQIDVVIFMLIIIFTWLAICRTKK